MHKNLTEILNLFPSIKLIIGIDANHYMKDFNIPRVQIIPRDEKYPTTIKKRSFIQVQYSKAGIKINEVKDHIISNLPLSMAII
jgi:hypothetical protein